MLTRPLGASGIDASVIGLGAWAIGGWMWGGATESESVATLHAALDAGINLIDTAPIYGFGLSEEVVGRALADRRDRAVLATKCGLVCHREGEFIFRTTGFHPSPDGHIHVYKNLSPASIREELESSLKRLRTDYVDLYQTHWQTDSTPIADTMAELLRLKDEGKIRAIGVSNAKPAHMDQYRAAGALDADQERYSMLDRRMEKEQLAYCRKNNIAVLAYCPMEQGLLTGKIGPDREFEDGDQRKQNPKYSVESRRRIQALLDQFIPIAERHGLTIAQLTLAWTVHQPGLTHALAGARTPQQARENAAAGRATLSDDDLRMMRRAIEEYEATKP